MKIERIKLILTAIVVSFFITSTTSGYTLASDSTNKSYRFSGDIILTNNGISIIPTFTLGKPAATFDLILGGQRLSFEPEFQCSLEGKPWSLFLWWRYKLITTSRFLLNIGTHPALSFVNLPVINNRETNNYMTAQRYIAGEFVPSYGLTENIRIGIYYLYAKGLDTYSLQNTHYIMFNTSFSNIRLSDKLLFHILPQFYYLYYDGVYSVNVASRLTLSALNFPISLSGFINKAIETSIPNNKSFIWNISLIYVFHKELEGKS